MSGFDRERAEALSAQLLRALRDHPDPQSRHMLAQIEPLALQAVQGKLDAPRKRAPGWRHFMESNLPGDQVVKPLFMAWASVVSGQDEERNAAHRHLIWSLDDA